MATGQQPSFSVPPRLRIPDLIDRKRRGERLGRAELEALVVGYTRGDVPDYQVAAWLMAVCCRGMAPDEVADLTEVMADSGRRLDLSEIGAIVADKHSTGGVGDKTSLVVAPLVAACGVPVAKMSGRGLGFTGGTLDKLESIPGLSVELSPEQLIAQTRAIGLAIVGQSPELAPADGKLYALRDVTGTVESIPLIASSIMSKKLAAGAHVIVLDVKVGRGAFMRTLPEARDLAEAMVAIGRAAGRETAAYVTDMSQPLGRAVGNALEVAEAARALMGDGPDDLAELAVTLAGEVLLRAKASTNRQAAARAARAALADGTGLEKLAALVRAQGGDERCVWEPERLPSAPIQSAVLAAGDGSMAELDARGVAQAALALGAGRERKGDVVDPAVGVVLRKKIGDAIAQGETLAVVHARDEHSAGAARAILAQAYRISEARASEMPLVRWRSEESIQAS